MSILSNTWHMSNMDKIMVFL